MSPAEVATALRRYRYRYGNEDDLQAALLDALILEGIEAEREAWLGPHSRVDLLAAGSVVVEVKVKRSPGSWRQIERYAEFPVVSGVVLVTNRSEHIFPPTVAGKPLEIVSLVLAGL